MNIAVALQRINASPLWTEMFNENTLVLAIAFSPFLFAMFRMILTRKKKNSFGSLPMVPNPHWLLGHFRILQMNFQDAWTKLAYDHAGPDGICTFLLGRKTVVTVTHAIDARSVVHASSIKNTSSHVERHIKKLVGDKTLLLLSGKEWKFHRSIVSRALTLDAVKQMRVPMKFVASTLASSLLKKCEECNNKGQPLCMNMEQMSKLLTVDIFGRIAFSYDFKCCETLTPSPLAAGFEFVVNEVGRRLQSPFDPAARFYWLPTKSNQKLKKTRNSVRDFVRTIIKERRISQETSSTHEKNDFLSTLMQSEMETAKGANAVDLSAIDDVVLDRIMGLMVAAFDSTSLNLTYALYCLATNPNAEARCLEEAKLVLDKDSATFDPADLAYCRAVAVEAARLYPPIFNLERSLEVEMEMSGHVIPSGTSVVMPIFHIHRDPNHFPRPLEFLPERWAQRSAQDSASWEERLSHHDPKNSKDLDTIPPGDRNAFFTFGAGGRSCPGDKLSRQELSIILAVLIRDLKFEPVPGYELELSQAGFLQRPKGGLPMIVSRRA